MKKKLIIIVAAVALLAAGTGIGILATGSGYGSESDPLISLSYITDKLQSEIESKVDDAVSAQTDEYSDRVTEMITQYQDSVTGESSGDVFNYVVVPVGKTLSCTSGTELMLRTGSCKAYGSGAAVLSDTTDGSTLGEEAPLSTNHMYVVTAAGGGVSPVGDDAELLVRGSYSIG